MEQRKSRAGRPIRAFSAIYSDHGAISDDMNQVLDSNYSEANSELENGTETSQQNTDGEMLFTALATDDEQKHDVSVEVDDRPADEKRERRPNWTGEPTKLLLDLLKETQPKLGKHGELRSKTKMFNHLASEMKKQGDFIFTGTQVENKFRGLERLYRRDRNRGKVGPYHKDLEEIFTPTAVKFDTKEDNSNSDGNSADEENIVDPRTARRQKEVQRELQKTLWRIAEDRQLYHNKVLHYLKRKSEREQRREELAEKKMRLMELCIKQLQQKIT